MRMSPQLLSANLSEQAQNNTELEEDCWYCSLTSAWVTHWSCHAATVTPVMSRVTTVYLHANVIAVGVGPLHYTLPHAHADTVGFIKIRHNRKSRRETSGAQA